MNTIKNIISLDCGNSSYRVVLGKYDGNKITTEVITQESNGMNKVQDYYYWDLHKIFDFFIKSLKEVLKKVNKIDSIGVCTWGVDFALYDKDKNMLSNPLSYRNTIGEKSLNNLSQDEKNKMFYDTGILCDKINSVFMLNGIKEKMPHIFEKADKLLMIPDILNYMLTGVMINEPSELSTTQLLSSITKDISQEVCNKFSIPKELFSEIGVHGYTIGNLLPSIKDKIGIDYDIPVILVPSHDTASAVVAIPSMEDNFAFISSGTWSLIGAELDQPVVTKEVLESNLTNELGAFNKITILKNSAGMFIIQRIKKEYDEITKRDNSWEEINNIADMYIGEVPLININNNRFFNPEHMGNEIHSYLIETNQYKGEFNWSIVIKAVQESMACCYAQTINSLEKVIGKEFKEIFIVGGGSKNIVVNELTAKRTGKKIIACSKESTSLGNIVVQIKYFEKEIALKDMRQIVEKSIVLEKYQVEIEDNGIVDRYSRLV
ncbi:rhamnulokinase [Vallitalea sp.]|jgi:sugar (pentulose or hexulose) kinase|uniref:rhamnulokinase n=1 Tax=Vallitalea sp. TaxID=1882829 RepID=UPI00260146BF|nr:FGGY family carbohydrate kinase [Vallitalea sp.]MCT4686889.1 FGGY family carbohydrate kinase [Vallitalea sp.]